ncbi:BQ5605_C040g11885 [Microbotryum silenes-dioicae]|uniref:BQ5605_C040g11885 protein n=1 Tax=Microbotryum silenes-dioicae TaxID=796604 RepID=A0A2X0MU72_9BASI|nr:BQ5605_C040g11885 [Microbotryum silenes-dioicae]
MPVSGLNRRLIILEYLADDTKEEGGKDGQKKEEVGVEVPTEADNPCEDDDDAPVTLMGMMIISLIVSGTGTKFNSPDSDPPSDTRLTEIGPLSFAQLSNPPAAFGWSKPGRAFDRLLPRSSSSK